MVGVRKGSQCLHVDLHSQQETLRQGTLPLPQGLDALEWIYGPSTSLGLQEYMLCRYAAPVFVEEFGSQRGLRKNMA